MIGVLKDQYELIKGSRQVALNFIEESVGSDLNTPVPAFENKTIRYLLVHTANCYGQWLGYFALQYGTPFLNDTDFIHFEAIRAAYAEADVLVEEFLNHFQHQMKLPINGTLSHGRKATACPLELFTHVTTHEFHHKGQIMTMARLLGHVPPDTDVVRT
jgi:uncharacterized damage-inducible protein DinB